MTRPPLGARRIHAACTAYALQLRGSMTVFGDLELANIVAVGAVTPTSARIWCRVEVSGTCELAVEAVGGQAHPPVAVVLDSKDTDNTGAWNYPADFTGAQPLAPATHYRVRLLRAGVELGEACFCTSPISCVSAPPRWTFGALSCHQPFAQDGSVHEGGSSMLRAAHRALSEADAKFVLMMGDQIYADYPSGFSLFDQRYLQRVAPPGQGSIIECSREQVRRIYQQRYRQCWAMPEFQILQSSFACYPILDDHEIIDNFGTNPKHAEPAWDDLRGGALDAFHDYQAARVIERRPSSFDYGFTWGPAAFYVMDIRSQRRTKDGKTDVYSQSQLFALRQFMERHSDAGLFALVTTIPLIYMESKWVKMASSLLSEGSDVHERWSHSSCIESRDRLIRMLHEHAMRHPMQTILLLGGDVHTGAAYSVDFQDGPRLYQLISSAISNRESEILSKTCELAARTVDSIAAEGCSGAQVQLLSGIRAESHNPFGGLNIGLVDVMDHGDRVGINIRLVSYQDDSAPNLVFESGELFSCDR